MNYPEFNDPRRYELPPIEHRTATMRDVLVRVVFYLAMIAFSLGCLWIVLTLGVKAVAAVLQ